MASSHALSVSDHDEEFVVPHMDISCLQNSYAYQRVLEEPWTYIHNWDSLTVSMQQAVMQSFMQELQEIKVGMAYTEGVYVGDSTISDETPTTVDTTTPASSNNEHDAANSSSNEATSKETGSA